MDKPTKKLFEIVEAFNELYPIGTELLVVEDFQFPTKRKLLSQAIIQANNSVVAKFEGVKGYLDIKKVQHQMTYKSNPLGMNYMVPCDANGKELEKHLVK
jgi:hypothetical protein